MDLPFGTDLHIHLREGEVMRQIVPEIRKGGCNRVLVMPNLEVPLTSYDQLKAYREDLLGCGEEVTFLMTLFLSPKIELAELARCQEELGLVGLKSYPQGVTTNSKDGVLDYREYFPIFAEMQKLGLILHIHGELPGACVMQAEEMFLNQLEIIIAEFPNLRIVLEHITTQAAVEFIRKQPANVGATITAHHLVLSIDDVVGQNMNFCKPVAKLHEDRRALQEAAFSGNPKFFFGSDSAPHPFYKKQTQVDHCCAAGIYTTPIALPLLAHIFEAHGCLDKLQPFVSVYGPQFFGLKVDTQKSIRLCPQDPVARVNSAPTHTDIVPFREPEELSVRLTLI